MIDKNLLIARIKCQMGEIIYQNQINMELDRSNDAMDHLTREYRIGNFTLREMEDIMSKERSNDEIDHLIREYRIGNFTLREMEDFMSKNTKELSDYKWNEENTYITFNPDIGLPPKIRLTKVIMNSLENNRPNATMTEESLIEQLKKNADKILRIRRYNASFSSIIERKTNTLKLDISKQKEALAFLDINYLDKNYYL